MEKIQYDAIDDDAIAHLKKPNYVNLMKVAIENSDAVVLGSEEIPRELEEFIGKMNVPVLKYHNSDDFSQAYLDFCKDKILQQ
jgi:starch synthase